VLISHPRRIPTLLFIVSFVILLIINALSLLQIKKIDNANKQIVHTYEVMQAAQGIFLNVLETENDQRSYLITGDEPYKTNLDNGMKDIYQSIKVTQDLVADNPDQLARLAVITSILKSRVVILNKLIELKQQRKVLSVDGIDLIRQEQNLADHTQQLIVNVSEEEFVLLKQHNQAIYEDIRIANILTIAASIIMMFYFLIYFISFNRHLSQRLESEKKRRIVENQLKGIIEGTTDLIAAQDLEGRYMIFNNAYEREFKKIFNQPISVGTNLKEILVNAPDYKTKVINNWQRAIAGQEFTDQIQLGKNFYETTFSAIKDDENKRIGTSMVSRNITQRMTQEQEMQNLNQELVEEMNKLDTHNKKMTFLVEMSDTLQACATVEEVAKVIASFAVKILDFSNGILYIMPLNSTHLEAMAMWGNPSQQQRLIATDQCWALRRGRLYTVGDAKKDLPCEHILLSDQKMPSYMCMPLVAQNNIYGLLYLESIVNGLSFSEHHRIMITATAEAAALALANVRLRDLLRTESIHDSLTGLYNRRFLEEFLAKEFNQVKRKPTPIAIIMLDIDYFKKFNDTYGHELGDKILQELGKLLQNEVRSGDIVCRYGGEEFIWVLHDCTLEFAQQRAHELREKIAKITILHKNEVIKSLTVSFGIAIFPEHGNTISELMRAADEALYEAKQTGRDKIVVYSVE
jgi:diguanylate cyclase (GGDEF)-like protein